ncbi:Exosome complex component RRP45B [Zea mays]|uniref:Exosome complex component RRP45B n=1 Tax=Zea mays TaxID=4577 RepID=A0A3L6D6J0_MAIZE|nr:Exosome complex component RRP45B [Zea mays]
MWIFCVFVYIFFVRESRAVDMEFLCVVAGKHVWSVRVDLHILDNGGNLIDAANIAALAALSTFWRPECTVGGDDGQQVTSHDPEVRDPLPLTIHHMPIAVTFAYFGEGNIVILTGHKENEEFVLAMCPAEPYVLSGGKDKSVVLWSIQDHISALGDSSSSPGASGSKQSVKTTNEKESPKVDPRGIFHGHDNTVEDVQFYPSRDQCNFFKIPQVLHALAHYNARHPGGEFDAVKPLKQSRVGFRGQAWFHINFWARPRSSSSNNKTIKRFFAEVHYKPTSISSPSSSSSSLAITAVPIVESRSEGTIVGRIPTVRDMVMV